MFGREVVQRLDCRSGPAARRRATPRRLLAPSNISAAVAGSGTGANISGKPDEVVAVYPDGKVTEADAVL